MNVKSNFFWFIQLTGTFIQSGLEYIQDGFYQCETEIEIELWP